MSSEEDYYEEEMEGDEQGEDERGFSRAVHGYEATPGLIDKLTETRLPDPVQHVLQSELSPEMQLAFHTKEEVDMNFWFLQNRKEIKLASTPPRESILQGQIAQLCGFPGSVALTPEERYELSTAYQIIFARHTGGRTGNQQKYLSQQMKETHSVSNKGEGGTKKKSIWDKVFGSGE